MWYKLKTRNPNDNDKIETYSNILPFHLYFAV